MVGQKPPGYDCLPQSTRSIDDFKKFLLQTVHDEQEGKFERAHERGLFAVHLHERPFGLPGLSDREEVGHPPPASPVPAIPPAIKS
jgi:hypothetical protein